MIELDNTMLLFIGSENYSGKENRWPVTGSVGSNPTVSAKMKKSRQRTMVFCRLFCDCKGKIAVAMAE